jgi:hypothetical protein
MIANIKSMLIFESLKAIKLNIKKWKNGKIKFNALLF